jgi:lyso-ornithine lipid O-acyltransferase
MPYFRRLYRIILLFLWFFFMYFYALAVRFLGGKGGYAATRRLSKTAKIWGSGLSKILNIKIKVHGNIDKVDGLIVSNHLSTLDILITASLFHLRFTPKSDIAKWPLLGWFIGCSKPIWIERNSRQSSQKTLDKFINTLRNNINLIIFPEGTTTNGKNGILPFKSTPFEAAVKGGLPVYPIFINYKGNEAVCYYGDQTLVEHLWKIYGMKKIEADVHILAPIYPMSKHRKAFSVEVHKIMNTEYRKLYDGSVRPPATAKPL